MKKQIIMFGIVIGISIFIGSIIGDLLLIRLDNNNSSVLNNIVMIEESKPPIIILIPNLTIWEQVQFWKSPYQHRPTMVIENVPDDWPIPTNVYPDKNMETNLMKGLGLGLSSSWEKITNTWKREENNHE